MSETAEVTEPTAASEPTRNRSRRNRGRRGRRKKGNLATRLWIVLGAVVVLAVVCVFGLQLWLKSYIKGDAFRRTVADTLSAELKAKGQIEKIDWDHSEIQIHRYTAQGYQDAAFGQLTMENVRADVDLDFWKRTVRVDSLTASRIHVIFDEQGRLTRPAGQNPSAPVKPRKGFLEQFAPNKFRVKEGRIDEFSLTYASAAGPIKVRGLPLVAKPAGDGNLAWDVEMGSTATSPILSIPWDGERREFEVQSVRGLIKDKEFYLRNLTANFGDTQLITDASFETVPHPKVEFNATVTRLAMDKWIKSDWIKKLGGEGKLALQGSSYPKIKNSLAVSGNFDLKDGVLQNLPVLESLADYLGDRSVLIMKLSRAKFDFECRGNEWTYKNIQIESEGTMRVEGSLTATGEQLNGRLEVGVSPRLVKQLYGAEKQVFIRDREGYRWTTVRIGGTVDKWTEDLTYQLGNGAINQGVEDVTQIGVSSAELAPKIAVKALDTASKAPDAINKGIDTVGDIISGFNPFDDPKAKDPAADPSKKEEKPQPTGDGKNTPPAKEESQKPNLNDPAALFDEPITSKTSGK